MTDAITDTCKKRQLECNVAKIHEASAIHSHRPLMKDLSRAVEEAESVSSFPFSSSLCHFFSFLFHPCVSITCSSLLVSRVEGYLLLTRTHTVRSGFLVLQAGLRHEFVWYMQIMDVFMKDDNPFNDPLANGNGKHKPTPVPPPPGLQGECSAEDEGEGKCVQGVKPPKVKKQGTSAPVVVSGAGHDALAMANITKVGTGVIIHLIVCVFPSKLVMILCLWAR